MTEQLDGVVQRCQEDLMNMRWCNEITHSFPFTSGGVVSPAVACAWLSACYQQNRHLQLIWMKLKPLLPVSLKDFICDSRANKRHGNRLRPAFRPDGIRPLMSCPALSQLGIAVMDELSSVTSKSRFYTEGELHHVRNKVSQAVKAARGHWAQILPALV